MEKPILLVTRKLPEVIEARAARDYDARLNPGQMHFAAVAKTFGESDPGSFIVCRTY
jgi:hypothetical protein